MDGLAVLGASCPPRRNGRCGEFSQSGQRQATSGEAGFALIDALVATMVLSLTVMLSLGAVTQANRAARTAWEVRRAHTLLGQLIDTVQTKVDQDATGVADGFAWQVETRATGAERPIPICRRAAVARNQRSGRSYQAAILESCPLDWRA